MNDKINESLRPDHILVVNLGGIGDFLLSTPALRALKRLYPQARISILIVPRIVELAKGLPYIDEVISFDFINGKCRGGGLLIEWKEFKRLSNLLFTLRKRKYDLLINMRTLTSWRGVLRVLALAFLIGAKRKVGRDTDGRGFFFNVKIPETETGKKHEMEYDIDTVEALGAEIVDKTIDFDVDDRGVEKVHRILKKGGIFKHDILIGIHPGGKPSHRWPIENFSAVIDEIDKKISCKFVITGSKDEVGLAKKLMKMASVEMVDLAGRLSIKELGGLIRRCNLFIANDTGPMHIAAILKTPLVAIFGPGDLTRYDPKSISDKVAVAYRSVDCSPCYRVRCKDQRCLRIIFPKEVVEAALSFLE